MALRGCLLPEKQGFRDLYWCWVINEPAVTVGKTCPYCRVSVEDARQVHEFLGHVDKPQLHGPNDDTVGTPEPSRGVDRQE